MGEYLTSLQKRGVGAFSGAFGLKERHVMTSLEANIVQQMYSARMQRPAASKSSPDVTQHSERHHEHSLARGASRISYVCLYAKLPCNLR